ncbi:MAG: Gfo/Idh/MocA family protein [Mycobacteriales bacterium]|nr:MAG: oxidoreductase [Pseudonocardiales bacterium]
MFPDLRVGIIGTGFVGRVHAAAARSLGAELVGVAASTPERAAVAARELGAGRGFRAAEELVGDPRVDVVHVCTPNDLHFGLSELALSAGKHVVCEKPLSTSVAEAAALLQSAGRSGLVAAVPFVYRFHPTVREARERVRSGETGPVTVIHGSYLQDWLLGVGETSWRVSAQRGGASRAFADIGSHWCDLAEWITGHRIVELVSTVQVTVAERPLPAGTTFETAGRSVSRRPVDTEDVACLLFHTDRGAVGSLTVSQVSAGRKNRLWIEVDGAEGSVAFDQENSEYLWLGTRSANTILMRDQAVLSAPARAYATMPGGHAQGYQDCFSAFVRDVYTSIARREIVDGLPTFLDGLRAARITDAVVDSARKGSWIEVSA